MALKGRAADKPIAGVGTEDPEKYKEVSEFMLSVLSDVLDKENKELEMEGDTKTEAELYAGYARAWGKRQEPALEIRRIPPRQGQANTLVRLSVKTFDPNAPRPGRPTPQVQAPANGTQATPTPAPATENPPADGKGKAK
jgi:hypothetical protein